MDAVVHRIMMIDVVVGDGIHLVLYPISICQGSHEYKDELILL